MKQNGRCTVSSRPVEKFIPTVPSRPIQATILFIVLPSLPIPSSLFFSRQTCQSSPVPSRLENYQQWFFFKAVLAIFAPTNWAVNTAVLLPCPVSSTCVTPGISRCTHPKGEPCIYSKIEKRRLWVRPMGGWNSILQAAWYVWHAHWARLYYEVPLIIWCLWITPTIWLLILSSTSFMVGRSRVFYLYSSWKI